MEIELRLSVKTWVDTDDPEEAELLAKELAYTKYRIGGLKYSGFSMGPEIDYQMHEIKLMGQMWDEIMSHFNTIPYGLDKIK